VSGSEVHELTTSDASPVHTRGSGSADPTDDTILAAARRACESATTTEETGIVAVPWRLGGRLGAYVVGAAAREAVPFIERSIVRAARFMRDEVAVDALGEGMIVVASDGTISAATSRAGSLLGTTPDALEGRALSTIAPWLAPLEVGEIVRGAWPDRPAIVIAHHVAPPHDTGAALAHDEGPYAPGLLMRLRSEERFASVRQRQLQLLSILRHDVRSPLTSVRGLVGVLLDEPDMPRDERISLLELLRQEAERTVTWVEDYLITLRLRLEPRPQHVVMCDLAATLGTLDRFFSRHAEDRQISYTVMPFDIASRRADLLAEPPLLEAFAKNLVGHAFRLADAGAAISVRLDPADLTLEVRGSGPGLFKQPSQQPFSTLARSTAAGKRTPGVGLGLYLAKKIADAHGWRMVMRQDAQEGLVVCVTWGAPSTPASPSESAR